MNRNIALLVGLGLAGLSTATVLSGCPASALGECDNGACDSPDGTGGEGGNPDGGPGITDGNVNPMEGGNPVDAPAGCVLTQDPKDSPACIDEGVGVFVDANSMAATPDGTRKSPYKTITDALNSNKRPRVYVCKGTYVENVKLDATHAESIYGGFACDTWKYGVANAVQVQPVAGFALQVDTVNVAVAVEDVEFDAPIGTSVDVNSIAAFVNASPAVALKRVKLKSQDGFSPVAPGIPPTNYAANVDGTNASDTNGAAAKSCTCGDGTTTVGGRGGGMMAAQTTTDGTPSYGGGGGVGGTNVKSCNGAPPIGGGLDGDKASAPAVDTASTKVGKVDAAKAWIGAAGVKGKNGRVGQGGGGGADGPSGTGGGGSGGCGGCGGSGGSGGAAGGASIALVTVGSPVSLSGCTLATGTGGTGGGGGPGEQGQTGGTGGDRFATGGGCTGGAGGNGSGGNGGAGGAGGVSFGLLFSGAAPLLDGVAVATLASHANFTVGGAGGAGASGAPGNAAPSGGNGGNSGPAGPTGLMGAVQAADGL